MSQLIWLNVKAVFFNYTSQLPLGLVANNHGRRVGVGMFWIGQCAASGFGDRQVDTTAKTLVQ